MFYDLTIVVSLIFLEGLLSADNALVLAILVKHLPKEERKKALRYGILGAIFFRVIAVFLAAHLRDMVLFGLIGGGYLCYLALGHLLKKEDPHAFQKPSRFKGFWGTVVAVELTDIAFSIDSIMAAVAMSPKLWVIITGGIFGIITMRFVAGLFIQLLDNYPRLETAAYGIVGWIGLKLIIETLLKAYKVPHEFPTWLFWSVMIILFASGFLKKDGKKIHQHIMEEEEQDSKETEEEKTI